MQTTDQVLADIRRVLSGTTPPGQTKNRIAADGEIVSIPLHLRDANPAADAARTEIDRLTAARDHALSQRDERLRAGHRQQD